MHSPEDDPFLDGMEPGPNLRPQNKTISRTWYIFAFFLLGPLTAILILFFIQSEILQCEELYSRFDDCSISGRCVSLASCDQGSIIGHPNRFPQTTTECVYGGYWYYPQVGGSDNPMCAIPYPFPNWLIGVCFLIVIGDIFYGLWLWNPIRKYYPNAYKYIPSKLVDEESEEQVCSNCGEYSKFVLITKACDECFGIGSLYHSDLYSYDGGCTKCDGYGKISTIDTRCPRCKKQRRDKKKVPSNEEV